MKILKKENVIFIIFLILIMLFCLGKYVYAKYILTKGISINISTSDYYFDVTTDVSKITSFPATVNVTVKNNDGTNYTDEALTYTISTTDSNYTISVEDGNTTRTLAAGGLQQETFKITINSTTPTIPQDSINLKFDVTTPYTVTDASTKEISVVTVNNPPYIENTGLTPVTISSDGTLTEVSSTSSSWYNYTENKWANAKTKDGSLWVWIPRFAYKITYTNSSNKSKGGTIDIVFLQDTTNLDFNGNDVTSTSYVDANGETGAYIVHPAFQNGTSNNFANGEWDEEISGFWVAKFEAGYEDSSSAVNSNVTISSIKAYDTSNIAEYASNYYGTRAVGDAIKYPVFKANRPSMNYIGISDAYNLCLDIKNGSTYGLSNLDSHLMKNSEWGAVAYLTDSKYGRNGTEVTINNVSATDETTSVEYSVTGYGGSSVTASVDTSRTLATLLTDGQSGSWTTSQGQLASSTGNIYGVYDLSGGLWEWTSGYVTTSGNYQTYGGSLIGDSTKYKSKYAGTGATSATNYSDTTNQARLGEAIWETSSQGTSNWNGSWYSWNNDVSCFVRQSEPFSVRGGKTTLEKACGIFAFSSNPGCSNSVIGFRPILIGK